MLNEEAANIYFIVFGFIRPGLELTGYRSRGDLANHYTTGAVSLFFSLISYLCVPEMIPLVVYRKSDKNNIFKNLKLSLFLINWRMELQVEDNSNVTIIFVCSVYFLD